MKCPVCKKTEFKEARQCPKKGGEPVCEACCKKCEYRGESANPCRYYIISPEMKARQELAQKKRRAAFLRKTADRLWEKGHNYAASQREAEWRHAVQFIKYLEGEIENEKWD